MPDKNIKVGLMIVGVVFLVSLTVLVNIIISNEVKRGHYIGLDSEYVRSIEVEGEGEVTVTPDEASVSFTVLASNENSEEAIRENNNDTKKLISFLKENGVEEKNIQTSSVNVRPIYDRDEYYISERRIIRYEVSNRVNVRIEEIDDVGVIINGAVIAGADSVNNLQFSVSDEEKFKNEARERAIKDARSKAEEITSSLGVRLGRVMSFSESKSYDYFPRTSFMEMDMVAEDSVSETPIEAGEDEVRVSVKVRFEIK